MTPYPRCGKPRLSDGQPCGFVLNPGKTCMWHGEGVTADDRSALAQRSALIAARKALLPLDASAPRWRSRHEIVTWLERQALLVGTGQLDRDVAGEMRRHAETALKAYELSALEKLDEFEKHLVRGGRRIS